MYFTFVCTLLISLLIVRAYTNVKGVTVLDSRSAGAKNVYKQGSMNDSKMCTCHTVR